MKKFLKKIAYTLLPVWLLAVLAVCYFTLVVCPNATGDIGRLAFIPFGQEYDERIAQNFPEEQVFVTVSDIDDLRNSHCDVMTIGDSFSEREEDGYQNYLALKGLKVVNVERNVYYNPVTFAYEMMDLGVVDSTNTQAMIVECVERSFDGFLTGFAPRTELLEAGKGKEKLGETRSPNEWSLMRVRDFVVYHSGLMTPPIIKQQLNRDFFTSDHPATLYFYVDDIRTINIKESHIPTIQSTFQALLSKAQEKHIKLILLVPADKYDLYQQYIVDNPYPEKNTNQVIRSILNDDQHLVLAKDLLQPMVDRGEQDVYLYNDTHWSYKAARVVADEVYERLQSLKD